MAGGIIEVDNQALEVLCGIPPPESVYERPYRQRDQDTHGPATEELAGAVAQGEEQITGCNREKRHAATHQRIEERGPEGIAGGEDQTAVI